VVALSDANGTVVEKYEYDVFGGTTIKDASDNVLTESAIGNPYGFTGRRLDTETDNYYYRARYFNPDIGRFLQTDPIGYAAGLIMYSYCGNNPINWIDPYGLMPQWYYRAKADFWAGIGDTAGWIHDKGMSLWHKTDNIRGPVGTVMAGTGGTLVVGRSLCK